MKINCEWLETYFEAGVLPDPEELAELLIFHAYEVEGIEYVNDVAVLDIDVLPNRASDSLSHRGIAREISTLLDVPLKHDPFREHVELTPPTESVSVTLDENASCTHYILGHITGVMVGPSPEWLVKRLESIGQKSINNVVDATNYVLFDLGHPTHVFDARKFSAEKPHVGVRRAKKKEALELLGGDSVELEESMSVIVDAGSDTAVAVAGVKGGTLAEVEDDTVDILIEAAKFDPLQTRLTAQALKTRTDASTRFENDVPAESAAYAASAVAKIILETGGGELRGFVSTGEVVAQMTPVTVEQAHVEKLLGAPIDTATIESILKRLGFTHTQEGGVFEVTAPFERHDINIAEDVIEEIGRVYGYEHVPSVVLPASTQAPEISKRYAYIEQVRSLFEQQGIPEVYTYSLRSSGKIALSNALASDKNFLRHNLADGVAEALNKNEKNMPLLGLHEAVEVYEIGNVFTEEGEATHICVGVHFPGKKGEQKTQERLQALRTSLVEIFGDSIPQPNEKTLEFNLDAALEDAPELDVYPKNPVVGNEIAYAPISQYPFVLRDIAVWVPTEVPAEEVAGVIVKHGKELLVRHDLFDEFEKDGKVSYAFHLVFQSHEKTLTDVEVGSIMGAIEAEIKTRDNWEIR